MQVAELSAAAGSNNPPDYEAHAFKLADKVDKAMGEMLDGLIVKGEEVKQGAITVMNLLRKEYGDDGLTKEFPRLGTSEKAGDENPEDYTISVKEGDGHRSKPQNFYTVYVQRFSKVKEYQFILSQCKMALNPKTASDAEPAYQSVAPDKLANMVKKYQGRINAARGLVRRAVGIWQRMCDLGQYSDRVELVYATDREGNPVVSPFPLDLIDATRTRIYRPISVSDAMRLDVAKAVKEVGDTGNLYEALAKQLKRGTKGDKTKTGSVVKIEKATQCLDYMAAVNNYIDAGTKIGEENGDMIRETIAKKKDRDLWIMQLGSLRYNIAQLWDESLETAYRKLIDQQLKAGQSQGTATAAKAAA